MKTDFALLFNFLNQYIPVGKPFESYIRKNFTLQHYHPKRTICCQDEIAGHCWFVVEGVAMEFFYDMSNEVIPVRFFQPGQVIVPNRFLKREPSQFAIRILEESMMFSATYNELMEMTVQLPETNRLLVLAVEDYYENNIQEREYIQRQTDAEEKVAYFEDKYPNLIQKVPSKYIAAFLQISPYTYSRIRSKFRRSIG